MTRALVLDPFSGVSGDMFLAALIDLGVPFDAVRRAVLDLPEFAGVYVETARVARGVFEAVQVHVTCPPSSVDRSVSDILRIVQASGLKDDVKKNIARTFDALADAEAKVHGCSRDAVHFHEVGALDAMFDIIGAHVALDLLGNPACFVRPITLGSGSTTCRHGEIPLPAPATLELLGGFKVKFTERDEELVTPTGAAIVSSRFEMLPADALVVPERVGYGAGTRPGEGLPNVLRAMLCAIEPRSAHVCIVTSTIDDMNPEVYGYVMDQLFSQGALDVYYNPVMMKKNRPGVEITVTSEEKDAARVVDFLMKETTTLGARIHREERVELARRSDTVQTSWGLVAVKVADRPGGVETMSPEYESCKTMAEKNGVPLIEIYEAARKAWDERTSHK